MSIDWSVKQPSYEDLHAQLDALTTERNAAAAESKLWLRRLLTMQAERDACAKSLSEWEAAYNELLRQFRRLEREANALRFDYEAADAAVRFANAGMAAAQ